MIRIPHLSALRALSPSRLQAASVGGRQSIFSRTFVTCFMAVALHSTFVDSRLSYPTAQSRSRSSSQAVNQRGCSPPNTLFPTAHVFQFRKTRARSGLVAPLKPHRLSDPMVPACGKVSYNSDTSPENIEMPERGPRRKGRSKIPLHSTYSTHPCIFPSPTPTYPCIPLRT